MLDTRWTVDTLGLCLVRLVYDEPNEKCKYKKYSPVLYLSRRNDAKSLELPRTTPNAQSGINTLAKQQKHKTRQIHKIETGDIVAMLMLMLMLKKKRRRDIRHSSCNVLSGSATRAIPEKQKPPHTHPT